MLAWNADAEIHATTVILTIMHLVPLARCIDGSIGVYLIEPHSEAEPRSGHCPLGVYETFVECV